MWTKDQEPPTPEHFDEHYLKAEGAHIELRPEVQERLNEVLEIVGPVEGKRILDLGGGALLGRACEKARTYVMVDMSKEACRICKRVSPWAQTVHEDVLRFLTDNTWLEFPEKCVKAQRMFQREFDVTVAIGLVEYLPFLGMHDLFDKCPSPVLAFTTAVKEGYLQYPARITVPTREEVEECSKKYGWKVTKELQRPDHVWARYERA